MINDGLPFVLVHGGWLWMAGIAGVMAVTLGGLALARRSRARRAWREKQAASVTAGPELVRGVLRGAEALPARAPLVTTLEAEPDDVTLPRAVVNLRAAEVYLVAEDGRQIELHGALRVLAGARPQRARGAVPEQLTDEELEQARQQVGWLHRRSAAQRRVHHALLWRLRQGERVVVRGQLQRTASDREPAPRQAHERWTLSGAQGELALHAARPALARPPLPVLSAALVLALAGAVAYVAAEKLGKRWQDQCYALVSDAASATSTRVRDGQAPVMAPALANTHACVLATAARKHRSFYLGKLVELLRWSSPRDEHHLATLLAVAELTGDCEPAFEILREAQRYPLLEQTARRCQAPRVLAEALEAQGRYEDAAEVTAPAERELPELPSARTLALAGRFSQAAARLGASTSGEERCTAALLRHWGDDPAAAGELRTLGASDGRCAPHLAALDGAALLPPDHAETRLAVTLHRWSGSEGSHYSQPERVLLTHLLDRDTALRIWLSLATRLPAEAAERALALRHRAVYKVLSGRPTAVAVLAAEARDLAPPPLGAASALEAVAQLFAGQEPTALAVPPDDELPPMLRRSLVDDDLTPLALRTGTSKQPRADGPLEYRSALLEAQRGEGAMLARYLFWHRATFQWHPADVLAVWPRVHQGHAELRRSIEWWPGRFVGLDPLEPAMLAVHAALRRDLLRVAGAEQEATAWARVFDRIDGALADPRKLFAVLAL